MKAITVFSAIADPTRREVLDLLATKPRSAGEIVTRFPQLTQPGVSRHLRVLREAQLVCVTINAQQRIYSLRPEGLRELSEWVAKYQELWAQKLDALEEHMNQSRRVKRGAERKE